MKKIMMVAFMALVLMGCNSASKNILTLEEAQEIALKEVSGKVLKAHEDRDDGVSYYDFTIVTDNEKYEVEVDANSGKVIKMEKDDDYVGSNTNNQTNVDDDKDDHKSTNQNNNSSTTNNNNANTTTNPTTNTNNTNNTTKTTITAEQAQQKAMDRVGGGYLVKCELDHDDGVLKYEIEIKNGNKEYDVDVDAYTGEIIKFDEEYDD